MCLVNPFIVGGPNKLLWNFEDVGKEYKGRVKMKLLKQGPDVRGLILAGSLG